MLKLNVCRCSCEEFTYKLSETASVESLSIKVVNITATKVIAVESSSSSTISYHRALEGYKILVAYIQVENIYVKSMHLNSSNIASAVVASRGLLELARSSKLEYSNKATYDTAVMIAREHLWEEINVDLEPEESYTIALTFLVPESTNIQYLLLKVEFQTIAFSVSGYQS